MKAGIQLKLQMPRGKGAVGSGTLGTHICFNKVLCYSSWRYSVHCVSKKETAVTKRIADQKYKLMNI